MDHRIIDLHVHSTESDGTLTPEDLVAEAKKAGLAAFALTDHDTCQGVCKAMPLAASAGIELIPGIELSTDYHGKEVHIVGLYIDIENEQLLKKTAEYRKCRSERNALMVEALQKEGLSITMEELVAEIRTALLHAPTLHVFCMNMARSRVSAKPLTAISAITANAMSAD